MSVEMPMAPTVADGLRLAVGGGGDGIGQGREYLKLEILIAFSASSQYIFGENLSCIKGVDELIARYFEFW